MHINHLIDTYSIYCIRDLTNHNVYIGSTTNVRSRINTHVSSFKSGNSTCSSVKVLENGSVAISVLVSGLTQEEAKRSELNFINAYGEKSVNCNRPIIISVGDYQKMYQKKYRNNKKKMTIIEDYDKIT
jgi:predicted GIY-YIG superfamily endonuclease